MTVVSKPAGGRTARRLLGAGAGLCVIALVAGGCAEGGDGSRAAGSAEDIQELHDGMVNVDPAPGDPVDGGELSVGAYSEPRSLDPAETIAAVTTGGMEMVNIYDALMRYDTGEQRVVPQMAKSLSHDDEYRTWTLTLRDGVTFSDGTDVDAQAVKSSQERYAAATGAPEASLWNDSVETIATPDDSTVVYELNKAWRDFALTLTSGPGMIVAESAEGADGDFTPVGAGPFELSEWSHGEEITLTANEDYWDGSPHLDSVRFVYFPTLEVALDTLEGGGVDMAYQREPDAVAELLDRGLPGYVNLTSASRAAIINAEPGHAGDDPRVRKAIALALDTGAVMQRGYGGNADGESALFPEQSRWHTDAGGLEQDAGKARELVDAAKADGFDGTIKSVNAPDQKSKQTALAVKAQLENVGFEVNAETMPTIADQIRVIAAEQDYDLGAWSLNFRESDPFPKMFEAMRSGGKQVYGMYTSDRMDSLIDRFQTAADRDDQLAVMADIQRQMNEDVPFVVFGYFWEYTAWQPDVHGVEGTSNSMLLLGNAWKES